MVAVEDIVVFEDAVALEVMVPIGDVGRLEGAAAKSDESNACWLSPSHSKAISGSPIGSDEEVAVLDDVTVVAVPEHSATVVQVWEQLWELPPEAGAHTAVLRGTDVALHDEEPEESEVAELFPDWDPVDEGFESMELGSSGKSSAGGNMSRASQVGGVTPFRTGQQDDMQHLELH